MSRVLIFAHTYFLCKFCTNFVRESIFCANARKLVSRAQFFLNLCIMDIELLLSDIAKDIITS